MTLYELAKNALEANEHLNKASGNEQINLNAVEAFANAAGINVRNNAFGIMLAFTSAKLIVLAVEEVKGNDQ